MTEQEIFKIKKTMIGKEVLIGLIVLICISNISAFAISSEYWSGNPLQLNPGETREFSLILQNLGSTSDLNLKAVVATGADVLRLADSSNIYTIPAGERGSANFIATVPLDAQPGQVYSVKIDFLEVKDSQSGEFGFGTAIGQSFNIIALPTKPAEPAGLNTVVLLLIIGGIVLVGIIIFILTKIKRKSHRKEKGRRKRRR